MLTIPAPAKLNLWLSITGRRPDGYHELQTLFQLVDLADSIELEATDDGDIELSTPLPGVPDSQHLAVRAAKALKQATGSQPGTRIAVQKQLPQGGGLGGGSSDAATTLLGLNQLWGCGLSYDELATIGVELGADVPVFIHGYSSLAAGIGEQLTPVELPPRWYIILVPPCQVSTADVFGDPDLTRDTLAIRIPAALGSGGEKNADLGEFLLRERSGNDCLAVVRKNYPIVAKTLDWLEQFGPAYLTGTGACVFTPCDSELRAREIQAQVPDWLDSFVTRGLNRSPTHRALNAD